MAGQSRPDPMPIPRWPTLQGLEGHLGDEGEAEDNGEILSTEEQVEVPAGHYDDAILTKDTITIQPDVTEYKLYAADVGPVLVLGISGGGGREEIAAGEWKVHGRGGGINYGAVTGPM